MLEADCPPELIWALRALAQPYLMQRELYPLGVVLGDELVEDWGEAYDQLCANSNKELSEDLKLLDELIISKSGKLEFWNAAALSHGEFWEDIRAAAKGCLINRGLSVFAPSKSEKVFVSQ